MPTQQPIPCRWGFLRKFAHATAIVALVGSVASTASTAAWAQQGGSTFTLNVSTTENGFVVGQVRTNDFYGYSVIRCGKATVNGVTLDNPYGLIGCTAEIAPSSRVILSATSDWDNGYAFSHWIGDCDSSEDWNAGVCVFNMTGNTSVQAVFKILPVAPNYTLHVNKTGQGIVYGSAHLPGGVETGVIDCGVACSASYRAGLTTTLYPQPAEGYVFAGWEGTCTGMGECKVEMSANKSVTAVFTNQNLVTLSVSKTGRGFISVFPQGGEEGRPLVVCDEAQFSENSDQSDTKCSVPMLIGSPVTLKALADEYNGYSFTVWSGVCSGSNSTCTVTMDAAKSVTATFTQAGGGNGNGDANGGGNTTGCQARTFSFAEEQLLTAYIAYYGRPADAAGLTWWVNYMNSHGGTIQAIIDTFGKSDEFTRNFGGLNNMQLVNNLYQQIIGRDAEFDGLNYWVGQLESGKSTLASIALEIQGNALNGDTSVINNRKTAARHYVTMTEGKPNAGWKSKDLVNWLAQVKGDSTSTNAACTALTQTVH